MENFFNKKKNRKNSMQNWASGNHDDADEIVFQLPQLTQTNKKSQDKYQTVDYQQTQVVPRTTKSRQNISINLKNDTTRAISLQKSRPPVMPLLPSDQMATAPASPPEAAVDPVTAKLDIMDYELKNLNETITTSISKCLNQNITMIKNYVQVKVDEFRMLRKEIDKQ